MPKKSPSQRPAALEAVAPAEKFISVKAASAFLGIPENTLYKKALAREIPSYKAGKLRRFKVSELAAWMDAQKVDALDN